MIDKKKIEELLNSSSNVPLNNESARKAYRDNLLFELGDDKEEVIQFISNADADTRYMLDEIYEELVEKFGEDIEEVFGNEQ